jgi:hypothetical protein
VSVELVGRVAGWAVLVLLVVVLVAALTPAVFYGGQ